MTQRFAALAAACVLLVACGTPDGGEDLGMTGGVDAGGCTDECSSAGAVCRGDTAVVCAVGADGCLAETETVCDGENESCEDGACVVDPCAAVENPCNSVGESACDGSALVQCVLDENDCAVEMRTDCGAVEGGFCDPETEMCRSPFDPCSVLENACDAAGATCDGDTAVVCAADAFRCLAEGPNRLRGRGAHLRRRTLREPLPRPKTLEILDSMSEGCPAVAELAEFVRTTQRGITPGLGRGMRGSRTGQDPDA